jgi:alanine-glyoxylate transaminase / serine-glyoxylate transaminase / serine-pyruvate transaminase
MMRLNSHPSGRHFLQIPGPTNVPDRILRAMDHPTIDHRGPEFNALAKKVLRSVRQVFQTKQPVVIYPASGTGAWEAALVNTLSPGDLVLMWETGHFASLWKKMADKLGIKSEFMGGDWTKPADPVAIEKRLKDDKDHAIKAVCIVHNETSTGVVTDVAPSMPRSTPPCCWSTRSPRWVRSTIATTPGASTSRSPARRRA